MAPKVKRSRPPRQAAPATPQAGDGNDDDFDTQTIAEVSNFFPDTFLYDEKDLRESRTREDRGAPQTDVDRESRTQRQRHRHG